MRKMRGLVSIALITVFVFIACVGCEKKGSGRKTEEVKKKDEMTGTVDRETTVADNFFPASYSGGSEIVKINCILEVPKEFNPSEFYIPQVAGMSYIDEKEAYLNYVEGNEIEEKFHYPSEDKNVPDEDYYILSDETVVGISGIDGFYYYTPISSEYNQVVRDNEVGALHENFDFKKGDDCVEEIKKALAGIGYPTGEFQFYWFSLSGEEHKILEQTAYENKLVEADKMVGDWTGKDEYVIYAWQTFEGLQVFSQVMTMASTHAMESYKQAQVLAQYTSDGCISLNAEVPYKFEKTETKAEFLPFDEIAAGIIDRYDNIISDSVYSVNRAKLALRVYSDELQNYAVEPVWYFEVTDDTGSIDILLFNAVTGKEIFLN